ncbi:MAG: SGNH hydrolase domain-containing protein [Paraglaciecola sp.]|uniref:SGNH hydrolase domain-containing protein n=1 Tax=Paraglaciecola sp. TaxID=1920173 RepID=UPI00329A190B
MKSNPSDMEAFILGHNYLNNEGSLNFNDADIIRVLNGNSNVDDADIILVGDSNSAHYSYGITLEGNLKVAHLWSGSCYAFIDINTKPYAAWMTSSNWAQKCHSLYKFVDVNKNVPVVIAQAWGDRPMECINNCTPEIAEHDYETIVRSEIDKLVHYIGDRPIFIIGHVPAPKESMVNCMKGFDTEICDKQTSKFIGDRIEDNKMLASISTNYENVVFVNPFNALCNDKKECQTIIDNNNVFFDEGHLSAFGSKKIWPYIEGEIEKYLQ